MTDKDAKKIADEILPVSLIIKISIIVGIFNGIIVFVIQSVIN